MLSSLSVSGRPYILFANKKDIRLIEVSHSKSSSPKTTVVVKPLEDAAALDYFLRDNKVCWTEIHTKVIRCSEIDPKKKGKVKKETVVDTGVLKPEGLAADWVTMKLYWTDSETKRIEVVSMEPNRYTEKRDRKVLVWAELDLPRSIAVAPEAG
jgi:hypothetical protein